LRHQGGNTAIIFGMAAIPLLALGGGAVDVTHRAQVRGELQSAVDTAAIAAARVLQVGELERDADWDALRAEASARARTILQAALTGFGGANDLDVDVNIEGENIAISTAFDVPTSFLGVIGIKTLPAKAMAEVSLPEPILMEIVLILDYSGSMRANDKYIRMTDAAVDFVQRVAADRAGTTKVAIVPFSEYVLADIPLTYVRDGGSQALNGTGVCVLNRDYPYSATDEPPSSTIVESQWRLGDDGECDDDYRGGGLALRDLTDDLDSIVTALEGMEPVGLTNISLATELGWHVLSPEAPFEAARDYSDEHLQKVIILLTDGVQTVPASGPSGDTSTLAADDVTMEICTSAKAENVRIFSIAYDVDDERVHDLLLGCASSPGSYFDARNVTGISGVFDEIYSQIAESVWLSR
jgi:hypothetical protein